MPAQEFDLIDYFGPVVVGFIFTVCLFLISFFCINFCCINKYDEITLFEKAGARYNRQLGRRSPRAVRKALKRLEDEDGSACSETSSVDGYNRAQTLIAN